MLDTAVLLLIFKRSDTALQVIEALKRVKPARLYIAADGPRTDIAGEDVLCLRTRAQVLQAIDWDCRLITLFRDENKGCGLGVAEAISWFFGQEEYGIILEDDCVPNKSFFFFCQELLHKYRHDSRIMQISGTNFSNSQASHPAYSYHFSQNGSIWGWASWRRAWQFFDFELSLFPELQQQGYFDHLFASKEEKKFRLNLFEHLYQSKRQTGIWDYQWDFARYIQNGFSIVPNLNLVSNCGFGSDATHTLDSNHHAARLPTQELEFPLRHPPFVMRDFRSDKQNMKSFFHPPFIKRVGYKVKDLIGL